MGIDNLGKKWAFLVADYAWGHSMAKEFGSRIVEAGGKAQEIRAPQDTKDFVPFLQKIDPDTEVLFIVFLGTTALGALRQTVELGLHRNSKIYRHLHDRGIGQDEVGKNRPALLHGIPSSAFGPGPKELQAYEKPITKGVWCR
jgi:branched-chain amino acid transport system substrate-binding protein